MANVINSGSGLLGDQFKEPLGNLQLDLTTNNAYLDLGDTYVDGYAIRCLSIYAKESDVRWAMTGSATDTSGSTTHFMKQDERINIKVPWNRKFLHARVNGSGTGTLEISVYKEWS